MNGSHIEDNYHPCERYEAQTPDADGFARFVDEANGQWYFAYFNYGQLILRSEGYVSESGRENGIESVKRYKDDDSNYRVSQQPDGKWVMELIAGNNKEIARSCRFEREADVQKLFPGALSAAAASITAEQKVSKAHNDDYLTCNEYSGQLRSPDDYSFTVFEKGGEYYFALVDNDGNVQLRSEGYKSSEGRLNGMRSVSKNMNDKERFKIEEHLGYYFLILTAGNRQEIARSCPLSESGAAALLAMLTGPTIVETITAVPAASIVTPLTAATTTPIAPPSGYTGGGFKWWWLLLPLLLLLLLWWLLKGCNKTTDTGTVSTTEIKRKQPVYASTEQCGWFPILYGFDQDAVTDSARIELQKVAEVLKTNPSYSALFIGFTDAIGSYAYNQDLSKRRAANAKAIAVQLGAPADRISIEEEDERSPVASNEDAMGRMYNRRVVMYVFDDQGRHVCKNYEYTIPESEIVK